MSLDDRLKGAYQRQLDEVRNELNHRPVPTTADRPGIPFGMRLVGIAAALLIVGAGAFAVVRLAEDATDVVKTEAGGSQDSEAATTDPELETPTSPPPTSLAPSTTSTPTTIEGSTTTSIPTTSSASAAPASSDTTAATTTDSVSATDSAPTTDQEATTSSTDSGSTEVLASGVDSDVCPSGTRAELEKASTRYVGENRGWNRKDDLVDEQDGPYYFMAWEPNYADLVTVELILTEPVLATDIRVFQDPFTPVSGTIAIDIADQAVKIELSETDGWRVHTFDTATRVERFTIERNDVESNIMEVMLCIS